MNLPEALKKQRASFLEAVPEEKVKIMNQATEDLSNSGIIDNCLKKGEKAPDFSLMDSGGESYTLSEVLYKGPVILKFFRGDW